MFVEIKMKNALWLLLLLLFASCASIDPTLLTEEEMSHVVALARERVSSEITGLSEEEKKVIRSEQPKYSYYKLSGNYADYSFRWDIKNNQRIVISGRGDILTLEGAKIERFNSSKEGKY